MRAKRTLANTVLRGKVGKKFTEMTLDIVKERTGLNENEMCVGEPEDCEVWSN